ncbi:MAG: YtxH domain-containing protein [Sporichthyaceae bacterium]|nr:YtxH domain-containing protein [Sporichthyaceae bacterium]
MRTKATFLAGFATGYVLGARAGRARYEQIRQAARAFASNPAVQSTTTALQHQATDVLVTAKDKATTSLGSTLHDKRPSWLGGADDTTSWAGSTPTGASFAESPPAGSNGRLA